MLYREIIAVCSQIHTKHRNTLCGQNVKLLNVKLVVHIETTGHYRVKSLIKTNQFMLYREIIAVCSQIHTKHINTLCWQNVKWLNVKVAVYTVTTGLSIVRLADYFDPEYGGMALPRNVNKYVPVYTASSERRGSGYFWTKAGYFGDV